MALLAKNYDDRVRAAYVLGAIASYDASPACTNIFEPGYNILCHMWTTLFPYLADPAVVSAQLGPYAGPPLGRANYRRLPSSAIRAAAGELDPFYAPVGAMVTPSDVARSLDDLTGLTCGSGRSCGGPTRSGWFAVDGAQLDASVQVAPFAGPGHCWFSAGQDLPCVTGTFVADPNYFAHGATDEWTLEASLRWLAGFTTK